MAIVVILPVLGLWGRRFLYIDERQAQRFKALYCVIVCCSMATLCALRGVRIGYDTSNYIYMYYNTRSYTLGDVIDSYINPDNFDNVDDAKDIVYKLINNAFASIFQDHRPFFFFCALIGFAGPSWLIYRYSNNVVVSFLLFMALGGFMFNFTGIRQGMALGITAFSYKYLLERRFKNFIFIVLAASLFHKSALCFAPVYFLNVNLSKKIIAAYLGLFLIAFACPGLFMQLFLLIGGSDGRAELYFSGNGAGLLRYTIFIIHFLILAFCFTRYSAVTTLNKNWTLGYHTLIIASLLNFLVSQIPGCFRLAYYYTIFEPVMIVAALSVIPQPKEKLFFTSVILFCAISYFCYSISSGEIYYPYVFFGA
ncbi:MAG: EpsG family protein [Thermoguttaceae bacterium]|nr:EpsG family protein [Thermoguttaceae bacterium]